MPSITICCNSFPPERGGAPNRIYNMAVLLRDHGYQVNVITAMPNYPTGAIFPGYRGRLVHKELVDGIQVIRIWMLPSNSGNFFIRGLSLLSFLASFLLLAAPRLLFRRSAGVIISSPPLINAWLAAMLAKAGRKKILVNISDIWPLTVTEMGALENGPLLRLLQGTEKQLYRSAIAFTGQSREILDHIRQTTANTNPYFLYRNLQEPQPAATTVAEPDGLLYAGNLGHAQGMADLCRQVDFTGIRLDIFGAGAERDEIAAYINEHPGCNIRLFPTLPQAELSVLCAAYKAVLIPLKTGIRGAVPSKLFMAVAHEAPVLFCGGGEGAGLVGEHKLGWTSAPGDHAALQKNIGQLTSLSRAAWEECRENVRGAARTVFLKPAQDKAFLTFIDKIFGGG